MPKLLSMIIPMVNYGVYISDLLQSISRFCYDSRFEVIVVNQSGKPLKSSLIGELSGVVIDHVIDAVVPAAVARNMGASLASGDYLFFLDDDAVVLYDNSSLDDFIKTLMTGKFDLLVVQRGELIGAGYISHWTDGVTEINYKNFPYLTIEWNFIIKKEVFSNMGCFPEIGTGSGHAALSGESYVLIARTISENLLMTPYPTIKVAHPNLFAKQKSLETALGYEYGAGYAVGISQRYFPFKMRIYWIMRVIAASLMNAVGNKRKIKTIERINPRKYKIALAKMKIQGFVDAVLMHEPKPREWLIQQIIAMAVINKD